VRIPALAAALVLCAAAAEAAEVPAEVAALEAEAEASFRKAGDANLGKAARDDHRRRAWTSVRRAIDLLEEHGARHAPDRGAVRDRLARDLALAYWLRRESPPGLLVETPAAGTGGTARNPFEAPDPGSSAAPAGPPPASLEQALVAIQRWEKDHPADAPGALQRWLEAMARFSPSWTTPTFAVAASRAAAHRRALDDVYRAARNAPPDALGVPEIPEVTRLLVILGTEIHGSDSSQRERAARILAQIGASEAAPLLAKAALEEKEPQTLLAMIEALADLGGTKGAKALSSLREKEDLAGRALDGLVRMAGRNAVDRALALERMGDFSVLADEAVAGRAVDALVAAGPAGARGLEGSLGSPSTAIRVRVMKALAETKDPATARPMSNFLLTNAETPAAEECRAAAEEAIRALGEAAVPHLFPALRNPRTRLRTGDLLRTITGQAIASGRADEWVAWWKTKHPEWKGE
jgi:hypothetical protein